MLDIRSFGVLAVLASTAAAGCGSAASPVNPAPAQFATTRCAQSFLPLPDPKCTPGALNPDVRQDTIKQTICAAGWTRGIRPPASYTDALKKQGIVDYGYPDTNRADYEEDHFLPLEVGGASRDPKNLWPEPHRGDQNSYTKDRVENAVKVAVCAGKVTLSQAQHAMLTNWTTAEHVLGIN